jgi:YidC/Oxa1 family membrane protein insertase
MQSIFTLILVQPLTNGLFLFYRLFGENLGLAIIGFSVTLIFALRPLTKPYMDSMKRIRDIQPQIDKLKKKFGTDKIKFSQAQAELYKQNKINPSAGCLPYILQFVVLIALFNVFTTALSGNGDVVSKLNERLYPALKFSDGSQLNTNFLYLNISKPDTFNIPGVPFALPGLFLLLAALAQFLSVKITTPYIEAEKKIAEKSKTDTDDMQVAMQQSMTYTMPLMTIFFGMKFPSGLALYWLIFSLVNMLQQVKSGGWGSLTPFIRKLNLLKSTPNGR